MPGLWKHEWMPVCFSLVVDDFGVKNVGEAHANHLIQALKKNYEISEDWKGLNPFLPTGLRKKSAIKRKMAQ